MNERSVFFISELEQVKLIDSFLAAHPEIRKEGYLLIPLDAEIEYALTKKGILFESGRNYRTKDAAPMTLSEEWTTSIFESKRWSFFTYRNVSLSFLYSFQLQAYFTSILYCADIVANFLLRHPCITRCIVFPFIGVFPLNGFSLDKHRIKSVVNVVTCLTSQRNIEVFIPEKVVPILARTSSAFFASKRMLFGWGIGFLNALITVLRRPRRVRILASDYWRNLSPYLKNIDSVEVLLLDRVEAFNAGLSNIWKFRMRFLHVDAYAQKSSPEKKQAQDRIKGKWQSIRNDSNPGFVFREFSLKSLVLLALDSIIDNVIEKSLKDIDDAYVLLTRLKPDIVELRSTISVQTHFAILAQVARALDIPSLDMQQGIEYYGPGSMSKRHSAEYMGVYGSLTQKELKKAGDTITSIIIGSPRFDVYTPLLKADCAEQPISHIGLSVLCIAPPVAPGVATDTYDIEEYFSTVAAAMVKVPNASIVIKLRPGPLRESFYRSTITSTFAGIPHTIAQFEPLLDLYPKADVVISGYSTAVLEALQYGKPLIYLGLSAEYAMMGQHHFASYAEQGALALATTSEEFAQAFNTLAKNREARERMSRAAKAFLDKEYAFDGKASERIASFINSIVFSKSSSLRK